MDKHKNKKVLVSVLLCHPTSFQTSNRITCRRLFRSTLTDPKGLKGSHEAERECFTHCNMLVKRLTRCLAQDGRKKSQENKEMCFQLCLKDYERNKGNTNSKVLTCTQTCLLLSNIIIA